MFKRLITSSLLLIFGLSLPIKLGATPPNSKCREIVQGCQYYTCQEMGPRWYQTWEQYEYDYCRDTAASLSNCVPQDPDVKQYCQKMKSYLDVNCTIYEKFAFNERPSWKRESFLYDCDGVVSRTASQD